MHPCMRMHLIFRASDLLSSQRLTRAYYPALVSHLGISFISGKAVSFGGMAPMPSESGAIPQHHWALSMESRLAPCRGKKSHMRRNSTTAVETASQDLRCKPMMVIACQALITSYFTSAKLGISGFLFQRVLWLLKTRTLAIIHWHFRCRIILCSTTLDILMLRNNPKPCQE